MHSFSLLISVYFKDNSTFLNLALASIFSQSFKPSEIVLVKDGMLTDSLEAVVDSYIKLELIVINIVALKENVGLGKALSIGLKSCKFDFVARMDADDICYADRFEKQFSYLSRNPYLSVLGTAIQEFNNVPNDLGVFRKLPEKTQQIIEFAKFRNPLNHPSVIFRKSDIIGVGSYMDMPLFEDYYLWIRVLERDLAIENLSEPLLHFRVGNDMIGRRHGNAYLKKEIKFLKAIRKMGFISSKEFFISIILKTPLRLIPKSLLKIIYKNFLR